MEHVYTVHTKLIQGQTYYFVKKFLKLNEFKGLADVVVGYGMHTDFEKACSIAGIQDQESRNKLLATLEKQVILQRPVEDQPVNIPDMVNKWLSETGIAVLN